MEDFEYLTLVVDECFSHYCAIMMVIENFTDEIQPLGIKHSITFLEKFHLFSDNASNETEEDVRAMLDKKKQELLKDFIVTMKNIVIEKNIAVDIDKIFQKFTDIEKNNNYIAWEEHLLVYPFMLNEIRKQEEKV